jgi:catecholate siderophore receptor
MTTPVACLRLAVLGTLAFTQVRAQDAGAGGLEEVVVTGRAGVEAARKLDLSYALTTIGSEALRNDAPLGVADALSSVPGFWVESSGGEASANIRVRGIPQEGFSALQLEEDGLPVQHDPGLGYLNADQIFRLDETLERVEVVRGGPGSIFASNAPGGLVNFITRRAGDTARGDLKLETSDYGLRRIDGWFGMPIGDWRASVGGFYREDDGVRDPGYTPNKGGQLRVSLGRKFEEGSIDFDIKHIDDQVIFYTGLPLTYDRSGDVVGIPGIDEHFGTLSGPETRRANLRTALGVFPLEIDRGTDVELTQYTFKLDWNLPGGWKLRNGLRYKTSDSSRIGLFPNTPVTAASRLAALRASELPGIPGATDIQLRYVSSGAVFDVNGQNGNGLLTDGAMRQVHVPVDEILDDLRLLKQFELGGQRHDVAVGAYFAKVDETFERYSANATLEVRDRARLLDYVAVNAAGNPVATLSENGISRYGTEFANGTGTSATWALYASDEWQVSDRWRIDAGARYETIDTDGSVERSKTVNLGLPGIADNAVLVGTGVRDRFDASYDDLGWTVGANWQLTGNSGLFARYTSTFRLPSVGSYITNATAITVTQTMDFIEAGYKFESKPLSLYATAFHTSFDSYGFSETVFDVNTGTFTSQTAYTDTKTLGLEFEGAYRPIDTVDIRFSATWQDPKFGDLRPSSLVNGQVVVADYSDNQLIRVPRFSYRVTPAVDLLDRKLRLELSYEYFGKRYSDAANSVELPDYDVVSANVRLAVGDRWKVYLRGENLLNETGLTEGNPRAGQFQSGEANSPFFIARPIFGRNYVASVVVDF